MDVQARQENAEKAARALCARIERYFGQKAPADEGIVVSLKADPPGPYKVDYGVECPLTFALPDSQTFKGSLRVDNTGGNMYEAEGRLNGMSASFSLSLEDPAMASQDRYGEELCAFLLEEVERQAGASFLRKSSP